MKLVNSNLDSFCMIFHQSLDLKDYIIKVQKPVSVTLKDELH